LKLSSKRTGSSLRNSNELLISKVNLQEAETLPAMDEVHSGQCSFLI